MDLTIELDRDEQERWIAEVREIPDTVAFGATLEEAAAFAQALALRALAERLEETGYFEPALSITFHTPGYWNPVR